MKKPENREVDGKSYQIRTMGPKRQIKTLKFIAKTVGNPLGILSEVDENKGVLDQDAKIIGLFIKEALTSIDDDAIIDQIEILLPFAERKNENGNFISVSMEKDFHGELDHLFKVVAAILEVNFGSFLGVSTGLLSKFKGRFANGNNQSSEALQ